MTHTTSASEMDITKDPKKFLESYDGCLAPDGVTVLVAVQHNTFAAVRFARALEQCVKMVQSEIDGATNQRRGFLLEGGKDTSVHDGAIEASTRIMKNIQRVLDRMKS